MCILQNINKLFLILIFTLLVAACAEEVPSSDSDGGIPNTDGGTNTGGGTNTDGNPVDTNPVDTNPVDTNPVGTSPGASKSIVISNTSPNNYQWSTLATNNLVYVDRSYTYVKIPTSCQGLQVLRTANDDKIISANNSVSFNVDRPVNVYVAHVSPDIAQWLDSWAFTGDSLQTSVNTLTIYKTAYPAGTISLGGNSGTQSVSMYVAFVEDQDSTCTQSLPGTVATGSANISWIAPNTNLDGTNLTDLAGFKIYYSNVSGNYPFFVNVVNPSATTLSINNLAVGTYYFVVAAYDITGNESAYSSVVSKTISIP